MEQKKGIDVFDFFAEDRGGIEKFHMFNYILCFAEQNEFLDRLSWRQFRSLFTSYCLMYGIDANTIECNSTLMILHDAINFYQPGSIEEGYDAFYRFMVKYIV